MGSYVVRRALLLVSTVVAVSFGAFCAFGISLDPTYPLVIGGQPQLRQFVRAYYHLNDPIVSRYWRWVGGIPHHGFGATVGTATGEPPSIVLGQPIGPQIWHAAGLTAQLVGLAMLLVVVGSALVGSVSARRARSHADVATRTVTYVLASVPTFLIGDLLRRAITPHETFTASFSGGGQVSNPGGSWFVLGPPTGGFVDWFRHMTLPALALAIGLIGVYARYVRSSMLVTLGQPYTTVARAKGLSEGRVVFRHALRNSLIPFTSALSFEFGAVIGASLAADAVFHLGGLASTFLVALGAADPFELTALVVVTSILVCLFMFLSDLLVGVLDPRVRAAAMTRTD